MPNDEREREWVMLMTAAIEGDTVAYHRFLESVTPALRVMALRVSRRFGGGGIADIEDVVQETLLAVHLKRHTWLRGEPLSPWLYAIARNKFIDATRRRVRRAEVNIGPMADELSGLPAAEELAAYDLGRLLAHLGEREQTIVRSVSVEGRTPREVAERLNMTEGAVRVALHRAIKSLAALLRKNES